MGAATSLWLWVSVLLHCSLTSVALLSWICYYLHTALALSRANAGSNCFARPQRLLQAQACGGELHAAVKPSIHGLSSVALCGGRQKPSEKAAMLHLQSLASPPLQARIEEVGQGLLRRTQEASGLGIRRKGQRSRFHLDAYEEHMLLPEVGYLAAAYIISAVAGAVCSHVAQLVAASCMDTSTSPSSRHTQLEAPNFWQRSNFPSVLTSGVDAAYPDTGQCVPRAAGVLANLECPSVMPLFAVQEHVVVLTNRRIMQLKAPGFAEIQRAAEMGQSPTSMADLPAAKVSWAVSWQVGIFNTCLAVCSDQRRASLLVG